MNELTLLGLVFQANRWGKVTDVTIAVATEQTAPDGRKTATVTGFVTFAPNQTVPFSATLVDVNGQQKVDAFVFQTK